MPSRFNLILVSGSTGWLGKRLVRLLAARDFHHDVMSEMPSNLRIRCLVHPMESGAELKAMGPQIEIATGDIRDAQAAGRFVEGAKDALLFHTAGVIHPRRIKDFYSINVDGARNLLNAAVGAGVRRAVVVSSNSPAGCNPRPDHVFDESSPYRPYMNYGRSKMLMELFVNDVERQGRLETVIVRPPWFYGPDQPARQTVFFSMIRAGRAPIVGSGNNLRSMAYVDNLCQGLMLAALTPNARGQTYWIADSRPYSMNEIIDTVERLMEHEFRLSVRHRRVRLPDAASSVAFVLDKALQSVGLYNSRLHVLSEMNKTIACSVAKAQRELGYTPRVALEEGMSRSIRWCLDHGQLGRS